MFLQFHQKRKTKALFFKISGIFWISAALFGFLLEHFGNIKGCLLCHAERWTMLCVGLLSLATLMVHRRPILRCFSWALYTSTLAGILLTFYHTLLQFRFLPVPAFCQDPATQGSSLQEQMTHFLSQKHPSCDQITLQILGIPFPPLLCIGFTLFLFLSLWIKTSKRRPFIV